MPRRRNSNYLTADHARRIAVTAQGLAPIGDRPKTPLDVLHRTSAVQLDTISVLARSHELVPYARIGPAGRDAVERAYWGEAQTFEYYAHAGCILPLEMWPWFAFRRRLLGRGVWPQLLETGIIDEVRARVKDGPVTASDLGGARRDATGWWNWSDAKRALEVLYARGEIVCATRRNWKRVYDLPERVIPAHLLAHDPSDEECFRELIRIAGRCVGVGTRRDIANYFLLLASYLARGIDRARLVDAALADSGLVQVEVEGWPEPAYADPSMLNARLPRESRATLLSPFDSLIWADPPGGGAATRARTKRLFGYDMTLEVYVPKEKRVHGYFTMPLLANFGIAGHVDPAREGRTLVARNLALHDTAAVDAMATALREAAAWVNCDNIRIDRATPRGVASELKRLLA